MTLDEAMRAAIAHHQEGRLAEAEQLYRAVLQVQAQHPDANHNLGALALQVNQAQAALPFLQTALAANPHHPQYWQSAAQALISLQRWAEAAALLDQATAQGLVLAEADRLRAQIAAATSHQDALHAMAALLESGRYADARAAAAQTLAQAPAQADAWAWLALAEIQLKDMEAAERAALQAVALAPARPLSLRALASVRLRQQQPGEAIRLTRQALAADPRHAHALMLLGSAKAMQGELDEADALLTSALQIEPLAEAHANRAIVALKRGQPEQAMAFAEQAVRGKPFLVGIWQLLVGLYQQAGRQAQVVEALEHIIAVEPGNAPALSDLGERYRQLGRLAEARGLLARAVAADTKLAGAWVNYAATLHQSHDVAEAIQALENALALDPNQPVAHCNLASMYRDSGHPDKALAGYNAAIALRPGHAETFKDRADVLKSLGQMDTAVQSYRQALALQPQFVEAHNNLGNAYKDMNRRQEAIDSFQAAIALKPDMAELHANLGHAHKQFGGFEDALAAYRNALARKVDHGDSQYGVGNVLWQLGDLDQALASFRQTVDAEAGDFFRWAAAVDGAIVCFLNNDLNTARALLQHASPIEGQHTEQARPVRAYYQFLQKLLQWWQSPPGMRQRDEGAPPLYVVGDSHSLSAHGMPLRYKEQTFWAQAMLIKGVKQWHLGQHEPNQYREQLKRVWQRLPQRATVLLTAGEIDCRQNEGIFKVWQKPSNSKSLQDLLMPTVDRYIDHVQALAQQGEHTVIVSGVPACNKQLRYWSQETRGQFLGMLVLFNRYLAQQAHQSGLEFLDVFSLTNTDAGQATGQWHIDTVHLRPDALQAAFNRL